jgi:hypothetical protein
MAGKRMKVTIKMDDGNTRVVTTDGSFSKGDRVHFMDGMLHQPSTQ